MNIHFDYPLERFMIWLTGNDKTRSVVIDEYIAAAIRQADPQETIANVIVLNSGCIIVEWTKSLEERRRELIQEIIHASARGNVTLVEQLRNKMLGLR